MFGLPEGEDLNWFGQVFLLVSYGFILFKAAVLIGDGSEKLLLLYGPGIIGGLVIPILGAVPDGAIVLVSGLGPDAQKQISVGVGTLAGSTIMLLTLPWAGAVLLGRRDYDDQTKRAAVKPGTNKPKCDEPLSMTGSCVTTYDSVPLGAKLMMATAASYLIVAIPAAINKGSPDAAVKEQMPALVGLIVCGIVFVIYSGYQVYSSNAATAIQMAQNRAKFDQWKNTIGETFGTLEGAAELLFNKFDKDENGTISVEELYEGLDSLGLECSRQEVFDIMNKINTDEDESTLTLPEFQAALKGWAGHMFIPRQGLVTKKGLQKKQSELKLVINEHRSAEPAIIDDDSDPLPKENDEQSNVIDNGGGDVTVSVVGGTESSASATAAAATNTTDEKTDLLGAAGTGYQATASKWNANQETVERSQIEQKIAQMWQQNEDEDEESEELELDRTDNQILMEALAMLLGGTLLCVVFSDPMVSVISNFSDTIHIPAFFISFILTPLASNAAEIYSTLVFAKKKTTEGISLGFSALYGAACMNNSFCLCIFCILIYTQELKWTFMVETLVILLTIIVVGCIGCNQTVFLWQACIVASMFPLSLLLVAVLDKPLDD